MTPEQAKIVQNARKYADERAKGYREQALKLYPWICGRCAREFNHANLRELTVHHRDHNHDNNPQDGSNWELLCLYCHDNEHQKQIEAVYGGSAGTTGPAAATHNPFANLKERMNKK
ncbi:HNH endonuclease [Thiothrix caldifontis]|jgi:HNH endonuclease.|uniref:Putative HNH nuclease YajD n=1 Tax=Thiothrix caldifontis TaxID=525918 RepID=A0A1H4G9R0_9GAMM|nr:YajD family HNH nuclease [Thiothrix caldifontis]SEB05432.1 HNH endonuclease [Thiothrix caldifontis]